MWPTGGQHFDETQGTAPAPPTLKSLLFPLMPPRSCPSHRAAAVPSHQARAVTLCTRALKCHQDLRQAAQEGACLG